MRFRALPILATALLVAGPASALTSYGDFSGADLDFIDVNETSLFGDPEPLFGAPTTAGNSLLFFPTTFTATSAGGGVDGTGSLLNLTLEATGGNTLTTFSITEFGDTSLFGAGTAATGSFIGLSGFLTVTEDLSGSITPVVIPFTGVVTPTTVPAGTFTLPTNPGVTLWTASVVIDITSYVPDATVAELQLNNVLNAASEAGTSALIQKKVVSGPSVIITVPEPATLAVIAIGLLGALGLRRRA